MAKRNNFPKNNPFNLFQNIRWKHRKISLKELIFYTVKFPHNFIQLLNSEKNCPQCGRASHDHNSEGKLFKYMYCHAMTLAVHVPSRFVIKFEFTKEIRRSWQCIINKPHGILIIKRNQFRKFEWFIFKMLSDSSTLLVIDSRMKCIGLKQG